jgi:hypothetical protein
LGDDDEWLLNF